MMELTSMLTRLLKTSSAGQMGMQKNSHTITQCSVVLKVMKDMLLIQLQQTVIIQLLIKLTRPQAPFLKNIAMSMFAIASPTAFELGDDQFERNPVGTGPFKFVEWKPNETITIEKFDDYWDEGLPKLKRIIFQFNS